MSDSEIVPGPSTAKDVGRSEETSCNVEKGDFKNAWTYCEKLLVENGMMARTASGKISDKASILADDLYKCTLDIVQNGIFVTDEELIAVDEPDKEESFERVSGSDSSSEYEPEEKKSKNFDYVPMDYKVKVLQIVRSHPQWSLKTLHKNGCSRLKSMQYVPKWEVQIKKGGTTRDKFRLIDAWTKDRFVEARERCQQVTTRDLQLWALAAACQFDNFDFTASGTWAERFKAKHHIRQHKILKFVTELETASMEEILASAKTFLIQARPLISQFHPDFVINTDQISCPYQSAINRTLTEKGSETISVGKKSTNRVTRSYTAQYGITLSGKLLPTVFVCLQEPTGSFGPQILNTVKAYARKYRNVIVVSSNTGKLSTALYVEFLKRTVKPYVKDDRFLLLLDSWKGHTRPEIYDALFIDETKAPTCKIKVIPPKCTPIVQPCDVYFYRQVRNFMKRLQHCPYLIEAKRELTSREDCIKIHSIVHHQLSSPIFSRMIKYAWFASKLCTEREIFENVNDVCFPTQVLQTKPCNCKRSAFIACARCEKTFCFPCFYDNYHCGTCKT